MITNHKYALNINNMDAQQMNKLNELTTDQLCDIVESNDTDHGTMFVDQSILDDFNIEFVNDVYVYNGKEYDCFSEIVSDNEEVDKAYQLALIELIENANWNNN